MADSNHVTENSYILKQGTILDGRYRIESAIGEGGFGITYEAVNEKIDMTVAIKEFYCREYIRRDVAESNQIQITYASAEKAFDRAKNRFLQEAKTLSSLGEENAAIVRIIDYFEENGTAYIVMNYLHGITLDKYLAQHGTMDWRTMLERFKPLVATLERVHNRGVIHRDISTSNIMVLENGSLCLLDFGAAKDTLKMEENATSTVFVKRGYTPLEQYAQGSKIGSWSDVYALSAVCYECLTGECPPDSLQRSVIDEYKTVKEQGGNIPGELDALLKKGLAVKVEDRYSNMAELLKAMNQAAEKNRQKKRRIWKRIVSSVAIIVVLFGAIGLWYYKTHEEEIFFHYEETERFCLVRDGEVLVDDFETDRKKIEERVKILVGNNPYKLEYGGDALQGVVPLKCFGKEDPREVIENLIARPNKWTISGVEIEREEIDSIEFSDKDKENLVITLKKDAPKELKGELASACDSGEAVLSVDPRNGGYLSLDGKMESPLTFAWNLKKQWSSPRMRELFLHNISQDELKVTMDIHTQIQSLWEERNTSDTFGKNQCDFSELGENKVTIEYWRPSGLREEISEGKVLDSLAYIKKKLDALNISYAIGRERYHSQRITVCVNQKDYNNDLFYFLMGTKRNISIEDKWRGTVVDSFLANSMEMKKDSAGEYVISVRAEERDMEDLQEAIDNMVQRNIKSYYLVINQYRLLEGELQKAEDQSISNKNGIFQFDKINMDDRELTEEHRVIADLLNVIMSEDDVEMGEYEELARQYTNGKSIVSIGAKESRKSFCYNESEADHIVKNLRRLSDKYKIASSLFDESEESLEVILPNDEEIAWDADSFINEIRRIMDICGMEEGTPWDDITIGYTVRNDKEHWATKISFRSPTLLDDVKGPYRISVIVFDKTELAWAKKVYEKMKKDHRFEQYKMEFFEYTD